jgi:hypothetical protein
MGLASIRLVLLGPFLAVVVVVLAVGARRAAEPDLLIGRRSTPRSRWSAPAARTTVRSFGCRLIWPKEGFNPWSEPRDSARDNNRRDR